jgi:pimeloyl-ACP methyl ester carboxylesterase
MSFSQENSDVKFANVSNAKIAYKTFGSSEPLIMCIGYSTNMDLWSIDVIDMLQKKFKVIVFDYRGMGFSTNSDSSFTINTLAEDLNELLNALEIEKTNVLGWSMGGFVAQMFAINHREKVNKLILYATDCADTITINPTQDIINILSNPKSTPLELLSTLFPDEWLAEHPEPWKFLPEAKEPFNSKAIGLQYRAVQSWLSPGGGSAEQLHKLTMPVLIIAGDKDKVVPCVNSTILADSIKSSTLILVNESGHGLIYQLPESFANSVISFLKGL